MINIYQHVFFIYLDPVPNSEQEAMHLDDEMFSRSLDGFNITHTKDTLW